MKDLEQVIKVRLNPKTDFSLVEYTLYLEGVRNFNLDKSFGFYGVWNLYFDGPVPLVLLTTRRPDLACFTTSGKVVGSQACL